MQSNIVEFLKTRKFWSPVVGMVLTLLMWGLPEYFGIEVTTDMLSIITTFLWGIVSYVVYGDVQYDWKVVDAANAPKS